MWACNVHACVEERWAGLWEGTNPEEIHLHFNNALWEEYVKRLLEFEVTVLKGKTCIELHLTLNVKRTMLLV